MKKLVFAFLMASVCIGLVSAPKLRAQDSITIKDPAEFNAYQIATSQTDPRTKASQLEGFLQTYPQSVVKNAVLDMLVDAYQGLSDPDKKLSAATRLLEVDPNNMKAIFISVFIKKGQCLKTSDAQTCDDSAVLAQKGLAATKPAGTSADDWKKQTSATYPIFHSAIAQDDILSKKDVKAGISEYRAELMLYPPEQTQSGPGLVDTLQLAEAYTKPDGKDLVQAIWFYARAWNFAPAAYKTQIELKLDYYYKKFHGDLTGLDGVKAQAAATVFPPATFVIAPAPTPADIVKNVMATTPDLTSLNLEDKEFILANGAKEDADRMWALLKDKATPVPGKVLEASASVIKLAVTQDSKDANIPDFIVNLKKPLEEKEIPAAGSEFGLQSKGQAELDGTYDTYTQIPATATIAQTAQIVLRDGFIQLEKKKPVPHKPAPGHKPAAH